MTNSEKVKSTEKLQTAPLKKDDLKRQIEASQKMAELDIKTKLSKGNIQRFLVNHSVDKYVSYKEWNKSFCKSVLGLEKVNPSEQKLRVKLLQQFLNKEVGGFSDEPRRIDSIDGMLGTHTLSRLDAYYKKLVPPLPQTEKKEAVAKAAEKHREENVYFVGDSYTADYLRGQKIKNKLAVASSHLVRTKKFDTNYYRNKKKLIFVEEEAMKFINNPQCKSLVINGGVNDLYSRGPSFKTANEIMQSYKRIIDAAHKKGVKVTVLTLNSRKPTAKDTEYIRNSIPKANELVAKINKWLKEKSGADVVIDSDKEVAGRLRDGLHADKEGRQSLYDAMARKTLIGYV